MNVSAPRHIREFFCFFFYLYDDFVYLHVPNGTLALDFVVLFLLVYQTLLVSLRLPLSTPS